MSEELLLDDIARTRDITKDPAALSLELVNELQNRFKCNDDGIFVSGAQGYWSNLSREDNRRLLENLKTLPSRVAIARTYPYLEKVIYSPKRAAGLELLNLTGTEVCIDYGCMWGALTLPLAQRCHFVLGIDQTLESLMFLKARAIESDCKNIALVKHDIRLLPVLNYKADVAVVNGVLEWIPENGTVELPSFYHRYGKRSYQGNPREQQKAFLRRVCDNLKAGGKLYLAIENRYDAFSFFGAPDPHTRLLFTSFAPRLLANIISQIRLGRPYVNWLYSFRALERLVRECGFSLIEPFMCFPDYRFPERILPLTGCLRTFNPTISKTNAKGELSLKRRFARGLEFVAFRLLQLRRLAPSIILIAEK